MMTLTTHGRYTDLAKYGNYPFETVPQHKGEKSSGQMSESEKEYFSENCDVKNLEEYYAIIDSFPSTYIDGTFGIDEDALESQGIYSDIFLLYKRYQAGMMDLDYGINMLIQDLMETGEIDNTVFVFYADHSAYFHDLNYYAKGIDISENYNTDLYSVPFFMWYGGSMDLNVDRLNLENYASINFKAFADKNSALKSFKITKFASTLDVLPTLLHLSGYDYNTNLYQGVSMFSEENGVFVSHEAGIFTEDVYFTTVNLYYREDGVNWEKYEFESTYKSGGFNDEVISFLRLAKNYYEKQEYLDAVVRLDYFSKRNMYSGYDGKDGKIVYLV